MKTFEKDIIELLTEAQEAIRTKMAAEGVNATGNTSGSIVVENLGGKVFRLVGGGANAAPLETLEIGTPPHFVPVAQLARWVEAKGLDINPFAIQRKISMFGTDRYINDNTTPFRRHYDIYSTLSEIYATRAEVVLNAKITEIIDKNF